MGKKKETLRDLDKLKDHYRLWAEYLKEIPGYRLCCNLINQRVSREEAIEIIKASEKRKISKKVAIERIERILLSWNQLYYHFQDIHSQDFNFDHLWESNLSKKLEYYDNINGVILVPDNLWVKLAEHIARKCDDEKRPITAKDIEQTLLESFGNDKYSVTMTVQKYRSKEHLKKQFDKIITEIKRKDNITVYKEQADTNECGRPTPIKKRLVGELQKYLAVYRLRRQTPQPTWKTIIETLGAKLPDEKGDYNESNRRLFLGYYRKAKQIIKNVNQGVFPGDY